MAYSKTILRHNCNMESPMGQIDYIKTKLQQEQDYGLQIDYIKTELQHGNSYGLDRLYQDRTATWKLLQATQTIKTELQQGEKYGCTYDTILRQNCNMGKSMVI